MAFVPAKRVFASLPISVAVHDDLGKKVQISFIAQYKRYKKAEIDDLADALNNKYRILRGEDPVKRPDGSTPVWQDISDLDFIKENLRGWPGVKAEDGGDLPYSVQELEQMVDNYPELVGPLFSGLWEAHRGAQQKN